VSEIAQAAVFAAKPGKGPEVLKVLNDAFEAAQNEKGTRVYTIHVSTTDPDTIWMYELYEDADAQQAHSGSEATATLRGAIGDLLREPLSVQRGSVHRALGAGSQG
jgi:quinol monooxygenase YgiN